MKKFCTLCNGNDIDIIGIYNKFYKTIPDLKKIINELGDNFFSSSFGDGIKCDRCNLVSFGIDRNFNVYGGYENTDDISKIGKIDQRNMELKLLDLSKTERYQNLKDKSEIVNSIEIPNLTKKEVEIRNGIEKLLNLSDPIIENSYKDWKDSDMSNIGLCSILMLQLKNEEKNKKISEKK